jgi:hypothetical protein
MALPDISQFANNGSRLSKTLQGSLACSVVSSDQGFMAEVASMADQYEFQQQQTNRLQQRQSIQAQSEQEGQEV